MRFFLAIFSSVTAGFWSVLYQQAAKLNRSGPLINSYLGWHIVAIVWIVSLIFGWVRFPWDAFPHIVFVLIFLLLDGLYYVLSPLEQKAMQQEKLSALQPYANVGKIVAIVCGFLILGERNVVTFVIAIVAFAATIIYASWGRKHKVSKGIIWYFISQFLRGVVAVLSALLITNNAVMNVGLSWLELATYEAMLDVVVLSIAFLFTGHFRRLAANPKKFYVYRYGGCLFGDVGWILSLILVSQLGIITSSILSLITMATTLILGFCFFHDTPKKSDIIFAVFIVGLICIWYIFKDVQLPLT